MLIFCRLLIGPLLAHDTWLLCDYNFQQTPGTITLQLSSGHDFPESDFLLDKDLINNWRLWNLDSVLVLSSFTADSVQRCWTANLIVQEPGVMISQLGLKRALQPEPLVWVKTIIVTGPTVFDEEQYKCSEGLEIVPLGAIHQLHPGGNIPLQLCWQGDPVASSIAVIHPQSKMKHLRTTQETPGILTLHKPGQYLLTSTYQKRSCSLTLNILAKGYGE